MRPVLVVAILALWSFNYLRNRAEVFENELSNAEIELFTCLKAHPESREQFERSPAVTTLVVADASSGRSWEVPYDRQLPLLLGMWCCAVYVAYLVGRNVYWSWLYR